MVLSNFLELYGKLKNMYFFVQQLLFSNFLCDTMCPDYLPLIVKVYYNYYLNDIIIKESIRIEHFLSWTY